MPIPPSIQVRYDELNLAHLCLISLQTRLPAGTLTWKDDFELDGRRVIVEARGDPEYGVPYGIDVDLNALAMNLFIEQGCPDHNTITITPYALIGRLRLPDSGASYQALRQSLLRLSGTTFVIEGWVDHDGGSVVETSFRLIERVTRQRRALQEEVGQSFSSSSTLKITLPAEIANNIRAQHLKPLDLDFMLSLDNSLTRGLFRTLDAELQTGKSVFEINLVEWGRRCRLMDLRPDRIRRTLDPAHQELLERRYLKSTEYIGRGQTQRVRYELMAQRPDHPLTTEQLTLVGRLKNVGVSDGQAQRFIRGNRDAAARVALAEAVVAATTQFKKSRGALAWDVLTDTEGRYLASIGPQKAAAAPARPRSQPSVQPVLLEPPVASVATIRVTAQLCLSKPDLQRLIQALEQGRLDVTTTQRQLMAAVARSEGKQYLENVLKAL